MTCPIECVTPHMPSTIPIRLPAHAHPPSARAQAAAMSNIAGQMVMFLSLHFMRAAGVH